jgi:hypothetical protein
MNDKPAIETMTNQERFNSAVMGFISEAADAIESCDAMSESAKRWVIRMQLQCADAYQDLFKQQTVSHHYALTDAEREAVRFFSQIDGPGNVPVANKRAATLRNLLERMK